MSFISPHLNTLIVEVGSFNVKIGYTGDFHPTYIVELDDSSKKDHLETSCKFIEKYIKKTMLDSLVYVAPDNFSLESRITILKYVFNKQLVNSITFLNCRVAEAFGAGKVTASILSCSSSSTSISLVLSGKQAELKSFGGGRVYLKDQLMYLISKKSNKEQILSEIITGKRDFSGDFVLSSVLESVEKINLLKIKFGIDIFEILKPILNESIEKIDELRKLNCMNKKNASNGCILLTGGLFRYETFYNFVKALILDKIGIDFNDFILRDKDLINSFAGASVFGMNNNTKPMFITAHDWQSIGPKIAKLKSF